MVLFKQQHGFILKPWLRRLQELQTEIFRQLQLLIPDQIAFYDSFQSHLPGSPLLRMDILERHPYTHFLRLTYQFETDEHREIEPDAHIRMYNDARLAEVTAFNPEQGFKRLAHPDYPLLPVLQRSWRQNQALNKWLGYLLQQGHGITSMQPVSDRITDGSTRPSKEIVGLP